MTTYFLTPHDDRPWGGIRQIYAMVDALCRGGQAAFVVHGMRDFRCSWFKNDTPVVDADGLVVNADRDLLVIPDVYGPRMASIAPGIPRVALIQNPYLFLSAFPLGSRDFLLDTGYPFLGAVVVSADSDLLLRCLFPSTPIRRVVPAIDPGLFRPDGPKDRAIAFMSRKRRGAVATVLAMLSLQGLLDGWELVEIDAARESDVARELARASVFLSFSDLEGLGLPPLEALASGCLVIGFDGHGGREYFDPEVAFPVDEGNLAEYARTVKMVLSRLARDSDAFTERRDAGVRLVRDRYSPAGFDESVFEAFTFVRSSNAAGAPTVTMTNAEASFGPLRAPPWRKAISYAERWMSLGISDSRKDRRRS
jgi:hypothetical protein